MLKSDLVTSDHLKPRSGSTAHETFRAALMSRTPEDDSSTLIITRQGMGRQERVWLTFDGEIKTTTVLTDQEVAQMRELLDKATKSRGT